MVRWWMYRWWTVSRLWRRSCTEEHGTGQAQARSSAVARSAPPAARRSSLEAAHPLSPCCHRPSDWNPCTCRARARHSLAVVTVVSTNEMKQWWVKGSEEKGRHILNHWVRTMVNKMNTLRQPIQIILLCDGKEPLWINVSQPVLFHSVMRQKRWEENKSVWNSWSRIMNKRNCKFCSENSAELLDYKYSRK